MPERVRISVEITDQPVEEEPGYYRGTATIDGTSHHIELWELRPQDEAPDDEWPDLTQRLVAEDRDNDINDLMQFAGSSKPLRHIEIDGRRFICAITPYSS